MRVTDLLAPSAARGTMCEFKGLAHYLDAVVGDRRVAAVGWSYADPVPRYAALRDHVAFYPGRVDRAWIGDEAVEAQPGDFYGGWITSHLAGTVGAEAPLVPVEVAHARAARAPLRGLGRVADRCSRTLAVRQTRSLRLASLAPAGQELTRLREART